MAGPPKCDTDRKRGSNHAAKRMRNVKTRVTQFALDACPARQDASHRWIIRLGRVQWPSRRRATTDITRNLVAKSESTLPRNCSESGCRPSIAAGYTHVLCAICDSAGSGFADSRSSSLTRVRVSTAFSSRRSGKEPELSRLLQGIDGLVADRLPGARLPVGTPLRFQTRTGLG